MSGGRSDNGVVGDYYLELGVLWCMTLFTMFIDTDSGIE